MSEWRQQCVAGSWPGAGRLMVRPLVVVLVAFILAVIVPIPVPVVSAGETDEIRADEAGASGNVAGADTAAADTSGQTALPATVVWRSPVSPTRAVLMSPLFPGWGQLYSDNSWRAALAFGVEMLYWSRLLMNDRKAVRAQEFAETLPPGDRRRSYGAVVEEYRERVRDFAWWSLGAMLIIALDAYVDAHLFKFDRDPVPVPNRWELGLGPADPTPGQGLGPTDVVVFHWRTTF